MSLSRLPGGASRCSLYTNVQRYKICTTNVQMDGQMDNNANYNNGWNWRGSRGERETSRTSLSLFLICTAMSVWFDWYLQSNWRHSFLFSAFAFAISNHWLLSPLRTYDDNKSHNITTDRQPRTSKEIDRSFVSSATHNHYPEHEIKMNSTDALYNIYPQISAQRSIDIHIEIHRYPPLSTDIISGRDVFIMKTRIVEWANCGTGYCARRTCLRRPA